MREGENKAPQPGTRQAVGRPAGAVARRLVGFAAFLLSSAWGSWASAGLPGVPVEQWRWDARNIRSGIYREVDTVPLVAQLTDDNGDSRVDENDDPDVAFLASEMSFGGRAVIRIVDGRTGEEHLTISDPPFGHATVMGSTGLLALGDVDSDGDIELITTDGFDLLVFETDGLLNRRLALRRPLGLDDIGLTIALADMNQDGVVEIILREQVVSYDRSLDWTAWLTDPAATWGATSQVADLDPASPGLELLIGNVLYDASGNLLWHADTVPAGATAIGDVDGDCDPEIALTSGLDHRGVGELRLLDHEGNVLSGPSLLPMSRPSGPLMVDLNGNGRSEVVVPASQEICAFEWTPGGLRELWRADRDDDCCSLATAFDFDGDGLPEIVYNDEYDWRVRDGLTGALLHAEPYISGTTIEIPVIADIDADGAAEILITGISVLPRNGTNEQCLIAYDVPGSEPPRSMWNQHGYHACNVNDDGTIPVVELAAWQAHRSWYAQQSEACSLEGCADAPAEISRTSLRVERIGDDVSVSFAAAGVDELHHLYRGTLLAPFDDHSALPASCSATLPAFLDAAEGNSGLSRYYLGVASCSVPCADTRESSYGRNSFGVERGPADPVCP